MNAMHLLFLRSLTSALLFTCLINKNFKHLMYDSIDRKYFGHLALRVFQGIFHMLCIFTSVKYLPLVYTSLAANLGPLLTAVFSYVILKKGLSRVDTMVLVISFLGVVIMIFGSFSEEG